MTSGELRAKTTSVTQGAKDRLDALEARYDALAKNYIEALSALGAANKEISALKGELSAYSGQLGSLKTKYETDMGQVKEEVAAGKATDRSLEEGLNEVRESLEARNNVWGTTETKPEMSKK